MKFIVLLILLSVKIFSAEPKDNNIDVNKSYSSSNKLGRIGDYGFPNNPQLDRAKGYLLKGKVKNAVTNYGNFITWDHHPSGLWNNFGYLPNVTFIAGAPGHVYSSKWSIGYDSWFQPEAAISIGSKELSNVWLSHDAYAEWMDGVENTESGFYEGNFAGIVYNTVDDRGDIAKGRGTVVDSLIPGGGVQWILDHVNENVILYLDDYTKDPNYASSLIGLAYPWGIRPSLKERTEEFDKYNYGEDLEEWTADDDYVYYGATFDESWFVRDGGSGPQVDTDWQATEKSRFNSHNTEIISGELFGSTVFTDPADPDRLLAHSQFTSTWPEKFNPETGAFDKFWPGWWADEYYGENEAEWSEVGITNCMKNRLDEDCWKPLPGRHISDMDVYMEFDDRWAHVGNRVSDNKYEQTGYPLGLKVMAMAHSYGISYAEDIMFVTVNIRNESGDFCAFQKDKNGNEFPIRNSAGNIICEEALIMPDGTKLNRGRGFNYKDLYLGFYMDADVLSTDAMGNFNVHTNDDDFMRYVDCLISKDEYPDGCPESQGIPLRISMAVIGDWDGVSNAATGYSMEDEEAKGPDFGVVAVQLLDSPYATEPVDLDQDGYNDIFKGQKLKMTDWHWFDWYNRPGVVSGESNTNCCAGAPGRAQARNKEEIQYKVMAGDNTNLSEGEKQRYFHADQPIENDPNESGLNPHFDSLVGLKETSFFINGDDGLDCVLEMSTGPFALQVGETVSFSFSIIFGQNLEDLKRNAKFGQIMYNSHYQGYTAPLTPAVLAKPGHNQIELYWDDSAEISKDVITGYTDFEGYKIYKSLDKGITWGVPEDEIRIEDVSVGWQPYAQFDLSYEADAVFPVTDTLVRGTGVSGPDPSAPWFNLGDDTGLENLLLDSDCWSCNALTSDIFRADAIEKCDMAFHCEINKDNQCIEIFSNQNCNADSALVCDADFNCCGISHTGSELQNYILNQINEDNVPQCYENGESIFNSDFLGYKYKYTDNDVFDGIQYTYSVVGYDMGVIPTVTAYIDSLDTDGNFLGYQQSVVSIPDPENWGEENSFQTLESSRGTTEQDKNYSTVIPGFEPEINLNNIIVVPNPYIVDTEYNETIYKKKLRFTRLPEKCTITIYTVTGEKVQELQHNSIVDGNEWWDLRTYNNQEVAPGLYIYAVEASGIEPHIGKFAVIR